MNSLIRSARQLIRHVSAVVDVALNRRPAGRGVTVHPDDIFLVSYPKSGNTWIRFLIGNLIYEDSPTTFANVETRLPSLYVYSNRQLRKLPRIMKSHECFDPRYRNVIYIVRDPRDVALSAYHYLIKMRSLAEDYPLEKFISTWLQGSSVDGRLNPWGSWYDHVASWLAIRQNRKFLLLRYEDLLENPARELQKTAEFMGKNATPERLTRAVELSSASHMRELEKKEAKIFSLTRNTRLEKPFIRRARSGNWKTELCPALVAQIEAAWGPLMLSLGYDLVTPEPATVETRR
jgi:hypothetical protein